MNTSSTPKVQYAYSQMPSGANHARLTSVTYRTPRRPVRSPFRNRSTRNRLVDYKSGSTSLEAYSYDALGRRIKQGGAALYYSADWQVLEERDSGGIARVSMVWSPVYIDAMIARDRDADSNGSLEERLYVAHDANFNVSSIIGTNGRALERFILDPYGSPTFLDGSWSTLGGSAYAWTPLHQGGRQSAVSSLYHFRHRDLSPSLGRWMTNDPIGFVDGPNLMLLCRAHPLNEVDPYGLQTFPPLLPPSVVSHSRCCALAYQRLLGAGVRPLGTVVCCRGQRIVCINDALIRSEYGPKPISDIVATCIDVHERFHLVWHHKPCSSTCLDGSVPPSSRVPVRGINPDESDIYWFRYNECEAWLLTLWCLQLRVRDCLRLPLPQSIGCMLAVHKAYSAGVRQIEVNCPARQIPRWIPMPWLPSGVDVRLIRGRS